MLHCTTVKCSLLLTEANTFPSTIFENKMVMKMTQIKFVGDGMDEHHHKLYSCRNHRVNFNWYISIVHQKQVAPITKKLGPEGL